MEIIEARHFARVKAACESGGDDRSIPRGPMADLVFEFEHQNILERNARMRAKQGLEK